MVDTFIWLLALPTLIILLWLLWTAVTTRKPPSLVHRLECGIVKCKAMNPVHARFCRRCGHSLKLAASRRSIYMKHGVLLTE